MVKIDDNSTANLDVLAKQHYTALTNKKRINGEYKKTESLIGRIQNQLAKDILFPDRVRFWGYFLENHFRNLERIIISRPDELQTIISEIDLKFGINFLSIAS